MWIPQKFRFLNPLEWAVKVLLSKQVAKLFYSDNWFLSWNVIFKNYQIYSDFEYQHLSIVKYFIQIVLLMHSEWRSEDGVCVSHYI